MIRALALFALWANWVAAEPRIVSDPSFDAAFQARLSVQVEETLSWLEALTGKEMPTAFDLLVARQDTLAEVLGRAYAPKPPPRVNLDTKVLCGGRRVNGVAAKDFVLLCWPDAVRAPLPQDEAVRPLLAHEFFHQLQYKLSGTDAQVRQEAPRRLGPAWMVEGSAEVVEWLAKEGTLPAGGPAFFDLQSPARRSRVTLQELTPRASLRGPSAYGISRFATVLLVQAHGLDALVNYFSDLGAGHSQDVAFAQNFGMARARFEEEFEDLRRDYGAARDWRGD